jgi:MFS transporter, DHA2 family, multidrug resistance protein
MTQVAHADLAAHITQHTMATISSTQVETALPTAGPLALAVINAEITRQALFIAYLDDFKLMLMVTFVILPLLFFMRRGNKVGGGHAMAME